jgi:hypothetical protein
MGAFGNILQVRIWECQSTQQPENTEDEERRPPYRVSTLRSRIVNNGFGPQEGLRPVYCKPNLKPT